MAVFKKCRSLLDQIHMGDLGHLLLDVAVVFDIDANSFKILVQCAPPIPLGHNLTQYD